MRVRIYICMSCFTSDETNDRYQLFTYPSTPLLRLLLSCHLNKLIHVFKSAAQTKSASKKEEQTLGKQAGAWFRHS